MPKEKLATEDVVRMINAIADAVIAAEPLLTDADRNLGDGDHGIGMTRGMTAVKEKLVSSPPETIDKALSSAGMAMISSMGGASGAIFGTMFRDGSKALKGLSELDGDSLAGFLKAAADGVMERGGAKPGDKTMVDALQPAGERALELRGSTLPEVAAAAATAAEDGREASKAMVATMGRAKTLGEKSVGHPDAGACSIAIILRTIADFIEADEE